MPAQSLQKPSPAPPPSLLERACAGFVASALMPDAVITEALVRASAHNRLDDLQALAAAVLASHALAVHHPSWQQMSLDVAALGDDARMAIGSSPLFRRWLHTSGRALLEGAPPEAMEPLLSAEQNYTRGFGPQAADAPGRLVSRQGCIETWDCASKLSTGRPQARLPESDIVVRNDLPGLRIALDETRTPERRDSVREAVVDSRRDAYPADRSGPIVEAAGLVLAAWPEEYQDWRWMMRVVVPRLPPPGWRMNGFTISSMQGASWVHPTDLLATLESLVHEHSHVKLRYVEEFSALLQANQTDHRFAVGWRSDPRPLVGILEGVYVHLHCVLAFSRCLGHSALVPGLRDTAARRMAELHAQAREGLALLRTHARFTDAGQGFLAWAQAIPA